MGNEEKMMDSKFLEDEIRDGFYIPTLGKRAWAAELIVLQEVDRICSKHHIKYFAGLWNAAWCNPPSWFYSVG